MDRYNITLRKSTGEGFVKETSEQDKITYKRYSRIFGAELFPDIKDDLSNELEKWQIADIEMRVKNWLDEGGTEEVTLSIAVNDIDKRLPSSKELIFRRSEVAFKDCGNVWVVFHLARSQSWPRVISSKIKIELTKDFGDFLSMKNEIRELTYSEIEAVAVKEGKDIIDVLNDIPF